MGGSATTDGGIGAIRALFAPHRLRQAELIVACDVRTTFVDAAEVFAPQKGATAAQVALLRRRLERLAQVYREDYGIDVRDLPGSGAAGGLAGGLAAVGAELTSGFDVLADELDLAESVDEADLVITGEGFLDGQSFEGKVVGGVAELAAASRTPLLVVAGEVFDGCDRRVPAVSLVERFGRDAAMSDAPGCVERAVAAWLSDWRGSGRTGTPPPPQPAPGPRSAAQRRSSR
jgi:glycerate kinase